MSNVTIGRNASNLPVKASSMAELAEGLAVTATKPMSIVSEAYRFISTKELGQNIENMGYQLHSAQQAKVLKHEKQGFQKHLLRFRLPEHMGTNQENMTKSPEGFPEIVVINSHDGTSSTRLMAGFFRLVCANGLISGSITDEIRIRHINSIKIDPVKQLEESLQIVAGKARQLEAVADKWRNVQLTTAAMAHLANQTLEARLKDTDYEKKEIAFNLLSILQPKRQSDVGNDLWRVFNVLQENAVKSKLLIHDVMDNKDRILRSPRSIDKLVTINKALWNAAEQLAA